MNSFCTVDLFRRPEQLLSDPRKPDCHPPRTERTSRAPVLHQLRRPVHASRYPCSSGDEYQGVPGRLGHTSARGSQTDTSRVAALTWAPSVSVTSGLSQRLTSERTRVHGIGCFPSWPSVHIDSPDPPAAVQPRNPASGRHRPQSVAQAFEKRNAPDSIRRSKSGAFSLVKALQE